MWDRLTRLTQPAGEPLTLAEAKLHGRIDGDDESAWLAMAIRAAREMIEGPRGAGIAMAAARWRLALDEFPCGEEIRVPLGPVLSIDRIAYRDAAGDMQVLAPTRYQWRAGELEARVKPAYGLAWPVTHEGYDAVELTFTAGFPGTDATPPDFSGVDPALKIAMLMLIRHWDEHRETAGELSTEIPFGFTRIVNGYRVGRFA